MPTAEKANVIEQTKAKYEKAAGVLFTEYRGLKVHQLQALRKDLKAKGGDFHVVKNTLFRLAAGEDAQKVPEEMTSGPTAVAFIYENESDCAKALMDFAKTNKAIVIKGGYLAGKVMDDKQVDALAKLPPRNVLIAQVIGTIVAPLTGLVGVIEALYADPIRVIGAVADKVNEANPPAAPAKSEPAPEPVQEEASAPVEAAPAPVQDEAPAAAEEASVAEAAAEAPVDTAATSESEPPAEAEAPAPEAEAPTEEGEADA